MKNNETKKRRSTQRRKEKKSMSNCTAQTRPRLPHKKQDAALKNFSPFFPQERGYCRKQTSTLRDYDTSSSVKPSQRDSHLWRFATNLTTLALAIQELQLTATYRFKSLRVDCKGASFFTTSRDDDDKSSNRKVKRKEQRKPKSHSLLLNYSTQRAFLFSVSAFESERKVAEQAKRRR